MGARRILITRTRHQASELASALAHLAVEPILVPMIEVVRPSTLKSLDDAIRLLAEDASSVDWAIFTSANAVQALYSRAEKLQLKPGFKRIAVIGPATGRAVAAAGFTPDKSEVLVPPEFVAESLTEALLAAASPLQKFLLIRAEEARDVIPAALEAAGHSVQIASAYRNRTPEGTLHALHEIFSEPASYPAVITFTSSSTAKNLVALLAKIDRTIPAGVALASIGPVTSATLRELGYQPTFEAAEPTIQSLAAAIERYIRKS